jgi:hypothetical protein
MDATYIVGHALFHCLYISDDVRAWIWNLCVNPIYEPRLAGQVYTVPDASGPSAKFGSR